MYADDTSIFLTGTNPDGTIIAANEIMSPLELGYDINRPKINTEKTKAIFLAPLNKSLSLFVKLELGDEEI